MSHEENVKRGYRAALSNERVSNQAKSHAQQELTKLEESPASSDEERHEENVARGLRAATRNPRVTDSGKQQAQEKLHNMGYESNVQTEEDTGLSRDVHEDNVARGLKAATHNPNVTDAGRKQARDKLQNMGRPVEEPGD